MWKGVFFSTFYGSGGVCTVGFRWARDAKGSVRAAARWRVAACVCACVERVSALIPRKIYAEV